MQIDSYFRQVYAAVLGKVIGVYMGRPFEGWTRDAIEARWGEVTRYLHADQKVPLVVADDDISGTFTFVRALEDSGLYADTPQEFFGETWLNYLIDRRTILWWGGMGCSTEHTAFIRLRQGVKPPRSGSRALNGRVVSEQIGAQIFIDAFGMVAPGNPRLAMDLAEKAARVSHDGEAVVAAKAVAAMVSLAFVEKDIHTILDRVAELIPADSLVARVHRDVRGWAREDRDWRKTHDRIVATYGYDRFGGGCHVIPNHAVMVLAWAYAGNDFFEAQKIVNTAGWDTDCNAGNVGTVCGLIAGIDRLDERYPFHAHPGFHDRMVLPTADGTDSVTDCLQVARHIARIGCRVSGIPLPPELVRTAWHDFSLPGALHGYQPLDGRTTVTHSPLSGGSACIAFRASPGHPARVATPILHAALGQTGYACVSTPVLCHGMEVVAEVACDELSTPDVHIALRALCGMADDAPATLYSSEPVRLCAGGTARLRWTIDTDFHPVDMLEIALLSDTGCDGTVRLVQVEAKGTAKVKVGFDDFLANGAVERTPGWIATAGVLADAARKTFRIDEGFGCLVTGHRGWKKVRSSATLRTHCSDRAGLVVGYQGLRRHVSVAIVRGRLQVARNAYGEDILFDHAAGIEEDTPFHLDVEAEEGVVRVRLDGGEPIEIRDPGIHAGGAGLCVETGSVELLGELTITAETAALP
jgi:ADP-ribosylglycohydrolase